MSRIFRNRRGATSIEYGLLSALVSLGMVSALGDMGSSLADSFEKAGKELGAGKDKKDKPDKGKKK